MLNVICTCVHIFSQEPCRGIVTEKLEAREAKPLPLKSCSYGGRIPSQVCDHSEPVLHPTISQKLLPWHIDLRCGLGPLHHVSGPACSHPVPCETVICESSEPTLHAVGAQGVSPKGSELGVPRGPKEKGAQYPFSLPGPQLQPLGWQNQRVEATALESATWGLAFGFESSRLCDPRQATSLLCALITEESDLHVRTRDRVSAVSGHFDYWSLGSSLLEKGMAVHSSILAWRPPWTEKPGGLRLVGSQRVGQDWVSNTHTGSSLGEQRHLWKLHGRGQPAASAWGRASHLPQRQVHGGRILGVQASWGYPVWAKWAGRFAPPSRWETQTQRD